VFKTKKNLEAASKIKSFLKRAIEKKKATSKPRTGQEKMFEEIKSLVAEAVKMAEKGTSAKALTEFYNKQIVPKLDLYGGEYLESGGASELGDEMFEEISAAYMKNQEIGKTTAEKKKELKELVKKAAEHAQEVYDKNKDKKNSYTGQLSEGAKKAIGKAEEKLRSSSIYPGGGQMVTLTEKEFASIVNKFYKK
jgi:cell division septum initiation protein DivIVA